MNAIDDEGNFFMIHDVHKCGNLPHEWSCEEAQLSHLETGIATQNLKACARLPRS